MTPEEREDIYDSLKEIKRGLFESRAVIDDALTELGKLERQINIL